MKLKAFKAAFPCTIPIMAGFLFLGCAYGIFMNSLGFSPIYPILMSVTIFAGSMEFVTANLLLAPFNPINAFFMALIINARHLFYGISMLNKFRGTGFKKLYLIFGMCDESFSINCSTKIPPSVDKGWFMCFVTMLNQLYWVAGSAIGAIFGSMFTINIQGIEFVMTALFIVIFLERWSNEKNHFSSVVGIFVSAMCLLIFKDNFMLPAMVMIFVVLSFVKKPLEKSGVEL